MTKNNWVFGIAAVVLPALIQVAYLAISEPFYSETMDQVDVAIFFASLASGGGCVMRLTRGGTTKERMALVLLYLGWYSIFLFVLRDSLCAACGWRVFGYKSHA
jgi:hypothetical protein